MKRRTMLLLAVAAATAVAAGASFTVSGALAQNAPSERDAIEAYLHAHDLLEQGNAPSAIDELQKALAMFESTGDRAFETQTLVDLGRAYLSQSQFEQAADSLQEALGLVDQSDSVGRLLILDPLSQAYLGMGRPDLVRAVLENADQTMHPNGTDAGTSP
jgi:tetratricopeptide (TPR) repeat protein